MMARNGLALALILLALSGCTQSPVGPDWGIEQPRSCGNRTINDSEVCDGPNLGGATCEDFGYAGGELGCNHHCSGYLVSKCEGIADWAASASLSDQELGPCASCGEGEVCLDGSCRSRTCGSGEAPERIEKTWDLPEVTVEGSLSVTGGERPERVKLHFVDEQLDEWVKKSVTLGEAGGFEVTIYPGTYRVWVEPTGSAWPSYPLDRGRVEVTDGTRLDLQIPEPVTLTGEIAPGPSTEGLSGGVRLYRDESMLPGRYSKIFDHFRSSDWPQSYEAPVYPGEAFDVVFSKKGERYEYGRLSTLTTSLAEDLVIDKETRRDFNPVVEPVDVSVRVDGEPPTEAHQVEVALSSGDTGEFDAAFESSEVTDEFALRLPGGNYRLKATVRTQPPYLQDPFVREVEVSVPTDGDVVIDVPFDASRVRLKGRVDPPDTWPDEGETSMGMFVQRPDGEVVLWENFEEGEPGRFDALVPEGTYDIFTTSWIDPSSGELGWRGRRKVRSEVELTDDQEPYQLELAAPEPTREPPVDLRGVVTVNGERIDRAIGLEEPGEMVSSPTGDLQFECLDEPCDSASGSLEDGIYEALVEPGRYRVVYKPPTRYFDGRTSAVADTIAGSEYVLDPEFVVREAGRRDFDLKAVPVEGRVTVDGGLPARGESGEPGGSGDLGSIGLNEMKNYWPYGESLQASGSAATFELLAFPGRYRVTAETERGGGEETRVVRLADERVSLTFPFRSTRIEGRLRLGGAPYSPPEDVESSVRAETPTGQVTLPIDEEGRFSGRVIGRDPRLIFRHRLERGLGADPFEAPEGRYLLREGCVR